MKNALILHGLNGDSNENWFPWLSMELTKKNWKAWVPNLPSADKPSIEIFNTFIFPKWDFTNQSIIVGHSAGAVAVLGMLDQLPDHVVVDRVFLVAGFTNDLGFEPLKNLFNKKFDWEKIQSKAKKFVLYHSDNDPYVPLEHGEALKNNLDAELVVFPGYGHFNLGTDIKFKQFPELLEKILE